MMMFFITITLAVIPAHANLEAIQYQSIPEIETLNNQITYLVENQRYYYYWANEWKHPVAKKEIIDNLKKIYDRLTQLEAKNRGNIELQLLMGELSHFLYNLEEHDFDKRVTDHYKRAASISPEDYRPVWFMAQHLSLSARPRDGMLRFRSISELSDPLKLHPRFWDDYAVASVSALMPSNALMAMARSKKITGKPSFLDAQAGTQIRSKIIRPERGVSVSKKDLWLQYPDEEIYLNRRFGMRLNLEYGWGTQLVSELKNDQCAIVVNAPEESGKTQRITFSFTIVAHMPKPDETLAVWTTAFLKSFADLQQNTTSVATPYKGALAYELRAPNEYKSEGGGHFIFLSFKRDEPEFPGVKVEYPFVPKSSEQMQKFSMQPVVTRFGGPIYYGIMLDTCESVYPRAREQLDLLLKKILVIE
jgi:hypothetical protein